MSRGLWRDAPTSPTSPTSPLSIFLDQSEDVLEWVAEWERRSANMDDKHVEVLISQWKLMRESAKEHAKLFHQMKKAMAELSLTSSSMQDRLDNLDTRLRSDMDRDAASRIDSLERRLREKINQEQANREAEIAELRELLRGHTGRGDDILETVKEHLAREKQAREVGLDTVQRLLAKEAEVLREVQRHLADETAARDRNNQSLQDHIKSVDRRLTDAVERQAALQATLKADLAGEKERREHDIAQLQGRIGQLQEKLAEELRKEQSIREAGLERAHEMIRELAGRDRDLGAVKDLLAAERAAREQQALALHDLLRRELDARDAGLSEARADILRERAARERLGDSLRATLDDKLQQQAQSMQARIDALLKILSGSTNDMVQFWRGAGRSH